MRLVPGIRELIAILLLCSVAAVACRSSTSPSGTAGSTGQTLDSVSDGHGESGQAILRYLREEIPPCTPVSGSVRHPCAVHSVPSIDGPAASSEFLEVPRYWQFFPEGPLMFTPHMVIRGTFLPNTTRCKPYKRGFPAYANFSMRSNNRLALCFAETRVSDYLIGKGPPQLTVIIHVFNYAVPYVEPGSTVTITENDWVDLEELRSEASAAYEGVEGVMFLTPSPTTVVEAWWAREFWDVQQKGDTVVVVAPYKEAIELMVREEWALAEGEPLFTEEDLKLLERPLSRVRNGD